MITKETLEAVNVGIQTDEQLDEALKHYRELEKTFNVMGNYITYVGKMFI